MSQETHDHSEHLDELCKAIAPLAARGLTPATGGNFSVRTTPDEFSITCSGVDKAALTPKDFLTCFVKDGTPLPEATGLSTSAGPSTSAVQPSAETLIHAAIYAQEPTAHAVFHTHSVPATTLSRTTAKHLHFHGYEMQKSIRGCSTHEATLILPLVENTQDMEHLYHELKASWSHFAPVPGFILKGHGLYAWGTSIFEAKRHTEGFEFLLECELHRTKREGDTHVR